MAGQPAEHAVNYAVLRSLQRAIYSPQEEGHYALASECYCHFTSPIRRYPDLTIHRLLDAVLFGKKPRNDFGELAVLGEHCSDRERRAEAAERELTKVKLLNYLATRIGEELDGVVTGVEEFGLFVQGIQLPAEGLVHVASLQDDYYRYERASHTLTGHRAGNSLSLGRQGAGGGCPGRRRSPRVGFADRLARRPGRQAGTGERTDTPPIGRNGPAKAAGNRGLAKADRQRKGQEREARQSRHKEIGAGPVARLLSDLWPMTSGDEHTMRDGLAPKKVSSRPPVPKWIAQCAAAG